MKKNLIRLLLVILSCILLTAALVACGGGGDDDEDYIVITVYNSPDSQPFTQKVYESERDFYLGAPYQSYSTFLGYFDSPTGGSMIFDANGYPLVTLDRDITVYAQWNREIINVIFYAEDKAIETRPVRFGESIGAGPSAPEKTGYDFAGWKYTNKNGTEDALGENAVLNDGFDIQTDSDGKPYAKIFASYDIKVYTVTFDYEDIAFEKQQIQVEHGEIIPTDVLEAAKIIADDKLVSGWSKISGYMSPPDGPVTEDMVLYAQWTRFKVFTLVNDINDSSKNEEVRVMEGDSYSTEPLRDGYEFTGYYTSSIYEGYPVSSVSYSLSKTTLYAKWEAVQYTITFVTNGGVGTIPTDLTYTIEAPVSLPNDLEREYATFIGWCKDEALTTTPLLTLPKGNMGNITLYAKYRGENRTVGLDANGGTLSASQKTVEYGNAYTLPIPNNNGYAFMGWYNGDTAMTDENGNSLQPWTFPNEEITFTAKWSKKYYITLNYSIDNVVTLETKEYYLEGETVTLNAALKFGYIFDGYYIDGQLASASPEYAFTMPADDIVIDVNCSPMTISVTLNAGEGVCVSETVTIAYGDTFTLPMATLRFKAFAGWTVDTSTLIDGEEALFTYSEEDGKWWVTDSSGNSSIVNTLTHNITVNAVYKDPDPDAPIQIFEASDMLMIADQPDGKFVLINDIDMSGISWTPFEFSGTLDGNNFSISNLSLTSSSGSLGMFTKVTGKIQNIIFENISIVTTSFNNAELVGGVCGELTGTLNNIEIASGSITGGPGRIGGLVGKNSGGTITNCTNRASVYGETVEHYGSMGGIVAWHASGTLSNCTNYGAIENKYYVGGIVGYSQSADCSELYNYGTVTGIYDTGGIVGLLEVAGTLELKSTWYNFAVIVGEENVGGLIGRLYSLTDSRSQYTVNMSAKTNEGAVIGTNYVGGIIGYAYINNSYNATYNTNAVINSLKNSANVTGVKFVGGLMGYIYVDGTESNIVKSSSKATVTAEAYIGGLFGKIEGYLSVEECSNKNTTIVATGYVMEGTTMSAYVGGYAGYGYKFTNCINESEISYTKEGAYVGGIAGYACSEFINCTNTALINAPSADFVGGIAGCVNFTSSLSFNGLSNNGNINGKNNVGGIFGKTHYQIDSNGNYSLNMTKLANSGAITGVNYVGGIIGYGYANNTYNSSRNITVTQSELINSADVTGTQYVGGLIGYIYADGYDSKILKSSSKGTVTAEAYIGGLAGKIDGYLTVEECSNKNTTIVATGYAIDGTNLYAYIGGFAGYGYGFSKCTNEAEINYTKAGIYVGGLAGYATGSFDGCANTVVINAPSADYVGGIAGFVTSTSFNALTNSGAVTGKNNVGGIFGKTHYQIDSSGDYSVNMTKLTNSGAIIGVNYVGGIIGYGYANNSYSSSKNISLTQSEFVNSADITGEIYVGGLIGYMYSDGADSKLIYSSSSGTITANAYVGGLAAEINYLIQDSSNKGTVINANGYVLDGTNVYAYIGGYVGYGASIYNCINETEITYTNIGLYIGGIAGYASGSIENCTNTAAISAPNASEVGGIAGFASGNTFNLITNSGAVTGKNDVGGIFGKTNYNINSNGDYAVNMTKLTNSGAITGVDYVGGIIGNGYANNAYSSSKNINLTQRELANQASVKGENYVGGLIGYMYSDGGDSKIIDSSSSGTVTASAYVGGLAGWINYAIHTSSNEGTVINADGYVLDGTAAYAYVGGYVGHGVSVLGCVNKSNITYTGIGAYVGGIAGVLEGGAENCTNEGNITAENSEAVGGIAGAMILSAGNKTLKNLTNSGEITGKQLVGGIVGGLTYVFSSNGNYTLTVTSMDNSGSVKGGSFVGGIFGYCQANNTYSNRTNTITLATITHSGSALGTDAVGAIAGHINSDGNSILLDYTLTGYVWGDTNVGEIFGTYQNITIN